MNFFTSGREAGAGNYYNQLLSQTGGKERRAGIGETSVHPLVQNFEKNPIKNFFIKVNATDTPPYQSLDLKRHLREVQWAAINRIVISNFDYYLGEGDDPENPVLRPEGSADGSLLALEFTDTQGQSLAPMVYHNLNGFSDNVWIFHYDPPNNVVVPLGVATTEVFDAKEEFNPPLLFQMKRETFDLNRMKVRLYNVNTGTSVDYGSISIWGVAATMNWDT